MRKVAYYSVMLSIVTLLSTALKAQTNRVQINKIESSREKSTGYGTDMWDYSMNANFTASVVEPGDELDVELPDGIRTLRIIRKNSYLEGTTSFAAREIDNEERIFSFTLTQGKMVGLYHHRPDESLVFAFDANRKQPVITDSDYFGTLGCDLKHDFLDPSNLNLSNDISRSKAEAKDLSSPVTGMGMLGSVDDNITIDLMIPYTAAASRAASRQLGLFSIEATIAQAMNLAQTALDNSQTKITLRLVHSYETDYDETTDGVSSGDRLRRLTSSSTNPLPFLAEHSGYMEEVHELRDLYGADLVALFADVSDTGGIAWVLGSPYGFDPLGFSLNRVLQVATGYTMIHEIGHNMGNLHSRTQQVQSAGSRGGLFQYSVGFQNRNDSVHTIMAYGEGLNQAPVFSTPDRNFNGARIGSDSQFTPADNSRSMREIKKIISSYRPTETDAPIIGTSTDIITIQLIPGSQLSIPYEITNTGASDLMWDIDFSFADTPITSDKRSKSIQGKPALNRDLVTGISGSKAQSLVNLSDSLFFNTSFEGSENYRTGSAVALNSWESFTTNDPVISVSDLNPATGTQHLRLENNSTGEPIYIGSPFMGPLPFGKYRVDYSFSFTVADSVNEIFEFYLNDRKKSEYSSALRISNNGNDVLALGRNEFGVGVFYSTGQTVEPDTYHDVSIIYNTDEQKLDYYLNETLIASNNYTEGLTPEQFLYGSVNSNPGAVLDIDDFSVSILEFPFSYLKADKVSGVIIPSESETINLDIDASNLDLGFYNTNLTVFSNDPQQGELVIPIQIEVSESVGVEEDNDRPEKISLAQNFPNPFNPTTQISYTLNESQQISVEVFDIQGRKVATLFDGFRNSGEYTATFDASGLASGVYIYRLLTPSAMITKRMVLIK